jgi:HlyD family secretion protein
MEAGHLMNRGTIAAAGLLAVGIAVPLVVVAGPMLVAGASSKYTTQAALVGTVTASATATGTISATTTYGLRFGANPDIVASALTTAAVSSTSGGSSNATWPVLTVSATIGQQVKKGDVLATADDSSAKLQLSIAQANLAAAQAKLATDKAGPDATTLAPAQDQVTQAKTQLNDAIANQTLTSQQNTVTLNQAQAAVTAAQAKLATDTTAGAAQPVLTADAAAVSTAQGQLASTQLKVDQSNQQAAQQVTTARLSLTSAQDAYASTIVPTASATIVADEAQIATDQAAADAAQTATGLPTIVAPADGTVTAVNIVAGVAAPSGEAIEIDSGPMVAFASFAETDVPNLKNGMAASATVSAANLTLSGVISQISPVAASTSGGGSTVATYKVLVTLDGAPSTVVSGMAVTLTMITNQVSNALYIPAGALQGSATNGYSVQVLTNGSPVARAVQVGLVTPTQVQITNGLSEGDLVVIVRTTSTTSGAGGFRQRAANAGIVVPAAS